MKLTERMKKQEEKKMRKCYSKVLHVDVFEFYVDDMANCRMHFPIITTTGPIMMIYTVLQTKS